MCAFLNACDPPARSQLDKPSPEPQAGPAKNADRSLAGARIARAEQALDRHAPDVALATLVAALEADPSSAEAGKRVADLLTNTRWMIPGLALPHPGKLPVERVEFAPPNDLWVCLSGKINTTVRWNLKTRRIESVLFPAKPGNHGDQPQSPQPGVLPFPGGHEGSRALVFDPQRRFLVIERNRVALLCDARSLKPIRDVGLLPDKVSPVSTIAFSPEGLLLAHVSVEGDSFAWNLRDTGTGEILRRSEPFKGPLPVAAWLDRHKLRALNADGSLLEMPVSPVEPVAVTPAEEPLELRHAWFSEDGAAALARMEPAPHCVPALVEVSLGGSMKQPDAAGMLARFPWHYRPNVWNGLMRESPALKTEGNRVLFLFGGLAPVECASTPTAVALGLDQVVTGDTGGMVRLHRMAPQPLLIADPGKAAPWDALSLAALRNLAWFLTGYGSDPENGEIVRKDDGRDRALQDCDFAALRGPLPELDFSPLLAAMKDTGPDETDADTTALLTERLARVASPPDMADLVKIFDEADDAAVKQAIRAAGGKGARAAKALELALASTKPEWIDACLSQAEDLPPLLRKLAVSRVAWLQDRKADAIAGWPDVFPDLAFVRAREDWDGWEQADFSQALEKLKLCVGEELAAIAVPENATPEQRKAVFERLMDPQTVVAVGKPRYARACLEAALAFSAIKEEKETTFQLATIARNLGEAPAPCLRAEAMALTALGDYQEARERWIKLITEHPLAVQQPGDYAEAAYTSFENADPRQAMNILTTGMHRFPNDANFALRAGWVSLLTGNAERAYRFLLTGRQIGYPDEKLENATALLAIAAVQTGVFEDAEVFYQDLIALDPAWENPETIETLEWPEELKASLRQLVW